MNILFIKRSNSSEELIKVKYLSMDCKVCEEVIRGLFRSFVYHISGTAIRHQKSTPVVEKATTD